MLGEEIFFVTKTNNKYRIRIGNIDEILKDSNGNISYMIYDWDVGKRVEVSDEMAFSGENDAMAFVNSKIDKL